MAEKIFVVIKDNKKTGDDEKFTIAGQTNNYDRALEIADETNFSEIKHLNKDAGKVGGNKENTSVVDKEDLKGFNL